MMATKESAKVKRDEMCHERKTTQVSTIWVFLWRVGAPCEYARLGETGLGER